MRRTNKNRRGFTLVEMMLALAIITIVFGLTTALMISIKDSFVLTYNLNDSSDYAVLYGYGIENSVLAKVAKKEAATWKIDTYTDEGTGASQNCVLMCSDKDYVFLPAQMQTKDSNGAVVDKWIVETYFKVNGSMVSYIVIIKDNYYNPTKPVTCKYEGSFWIPHSSVKLTTEGTEYDMDSSYKSVLKYDGK
ncbi:MAG: prepilin-type N-terminal cleavage/methylation domain-containing protein [Clostridiales bacterium]|nr:prepilin-type N-terminal cleavage/methylation domain-containing protein [Clostridiales bacterium]